MRSRHLPGLVISAVIIGLVAATAAFAATESAVVGPGACPAHLKVGQHAILRHGWERVCGPGSALVSFKGVSYSVHGGYCSDGRVDFGISGPGSTPHRGFWIVLAHHGAGAVKVVDGEVELVPGIRVALSGTAVVEPGLKGGTFKVFGRGGSNGTTPTGSRFTGSWNCG